MIKALIVDSEPACCEELNTLLQRCCRQISVAAICHSCTEARAAIEGHKPDLVFFDVELPHMNSFEFLEKLPEVNFQIIFTTRYDQYAIRALRLNALDYLLKPVDPEELQHAAAKVAQRVQQSFSQRLEVLIDKIKHPQPGINKIAVPTQHGLQMVAVESIISCQSDSNYSVLYLKDKRKIVVSRTLKEIEELLSLYSFVRVHHSFLVNLNEIEKYVKGEGGWLVMSDGSHVDVSRSRKEVLLQRLLHQRH